MGLEKVVLLTSELAAWLKKRAERRFVAGPGLKCSADERTINYALDPGLAAKLIGAGGGGGGGVTLVKCVIDGGAAEPCSWTYTIWAAGVDPDATPTPPSLATGQAPQTRRIPQIKYDFAAFEGAWSWGLGFRYGTPPAWLLYHVAGEYPAVNGCECV